MIYRVLGLDPGLSSATATVFGYANGKNYPEILDVLDIPTKGEGSGKRINVQAFFDWLEKTSPDIAYVEAANAMPAIPDKFGNRRGMGAASSGRYMRAAGALESAVDLFGIDTVFIQPATWKRALGLIGEKKGASLEMIRGLYPECADKWFRRQKDHNRAESCLIAIYGGIRTDIVSLRAT